MSTDTAGCRIHPLKLFLFAHRRWHQQRNVSDYIVTQDGYTSAGKAIKSDRAGSRTAPTRAKCIAHLQSAARHAYIWARTPMGGSANRATRPTERAVLAGGCFWGMQDLIRRQPGVISTRVGYSGGDVPNATYRNHGTHAEAIEIIFDPDVTSYRTMLEFFFQIHDPSTLQPPGQRRRRSATARRSSTPATRRRRRPRTPSPTSTPPACGPARWSPKSRRPAISGRPSRSTRIIWSTSPTATPATSRGRTGSCRGARDAARRLGSDQGRTLDPQASSRRGSDPVGGPSRARREARRRCGGFPAGRAGSRYPGARRHAASPRRAAGRRW